jgi:hypothetical protein
MSFVLEDDDDDDDLTLMMIIDIATSDEYRMHW